MCNGLAFAEALGPTLRLGVQEAAELATDGLGTADREALVVALAADRVRVAADVDAHHRRRVECPRKERQAGPRRRKQRGVGELEANDDPIRVAWTCDHSAPKGTHSSPQTPHGALEAARGSAQLLGFAFEEPCLTSERTSARLKVRLAPRQRRGVYQTDGRDAGGRAATRQEHV
jgi:hypothetical protein